MARRGRKAASTASMPEMDEVDAFAADQEEILLEQAGNYGKSHQQEQDSEEEVMRMDSDDSQDDESSQEEEEEEEANEDDEAEQGWGARANYYGGDEVDDADTAKQMTEEAIKQQKKHLQELGIDDFIDEDMMEDWNKTAQEFDDKASNKVSIVINEDGNDIDKLDQSEKLELLSQSFPEFVPLLKELKTLQQAMKSLSQQSGDVVDVQKIALTAYTGAISSYFSIFIDHVHSGEVFANMKDHPVMETILTTRQIWSEAKALQPAHESSDSDQDEFVDAEAYESEELENAEGISDESEEEVDQSEESEESESDDELDISTKRKIKSVSSKKSGDFDEADTPDDVDMEDKQGRKKSLRFYTSKIDQSQLKNSEKFSGDLDLPYKERYFEAKQRLLEEARKRGLGEDKAQLGDDLDDAEFDSGDEQDARGINEDGNDYYNTLKQKNSDKKDARRSAHKLAVQAAKEGRLAEAQELTGKDGKRALNFQILKNKGLTAKKNKEIRNARVKKRKKYEAAKKKLKSVRQVYDDSNRGPYEGEKTGIKKGLSRSVKLV